MKRTLAPLEGGPRWRPLFWLRDYPGLVDHLMDEWSAGSGTWQSKMATADVRGRLERIASDYLDIAKPHAAPVRRKAIAREELKLAKAIQKVLALLGSARDDRQPSDSTSAPQIPKRSIPGDSKAQHFTAEDVSRGVRLTATRIFRSSDSGQRQLDNLEELLGILMRGLERSASAAPGTSPSVGRPNRQHVHNMVLDLVGLWEVAFARKFPATLDTARTDGSSAGHAEFAASPAHFVHALAHAIDQETSVSDVTVAVRSRRHV